MSLIYIICTIYQIIMLAGRVRSVICHDAALVAHGSVVCLVRFAGYDPFAQHLINSCGGSNG